MPGLTVLDPVHLDPPVILAYDPVGRPPTALVSAERGARPVILVQGTRNCTTLRLTERGCRRKVPLIDLCLSECGTDLYPLHVGHLFVQSLRVITWCSALSPLPAFGPYTATRLPRERTTDPIGGPKKGIPAHAYTAVVPTDAAWASLFWSRL
jgi:hypothetical protein